MAFGYPDKPQANYTAAIQDKFKISTILELYDSMKRRQNKYGTSSSSRKDKNFCHKVNFKNLEIF